MDSCAHGFREEFGQGTAGMEGVPLIHNTWGLGWEDLRVGVGSGRLHLSGWCLGWRGLMARTADSAPLHEAWPPHSRLVGFFTLHAGTPNMSVPGNKAEAEWPFITQPWVGSAVFYWLKQSQAYPDSRRKGKPLPLEG